MKQSRKAKAEKIGKDVDNNLKYCLPLWEVTCELCVLRGQLLNPVTTEGAEFRRETPTEADGIGPNHYPLVARKLANEPHKRQTATKP